MTAGGSRTPLTVMESWSELRPTTNPYIHMLDDALRRTPGVNLVRFDRRVALTGRYDVLHLHWPETLLGGRTRAHRLARRAFFTALMLRLRLSRIALVRTVHNVELPQDLTGWERRLLEAVEARADYRIAINTSTTGLEPDRSTVIPHGHYVDWFDDEPEAVPDPRLLGFVGLVRRYKGVEGLLKAFTSTAVDDPSVRLLVAGHPTSDQMAESVRALAQADSRIELDLRHLSESEFAASVRRCSGIVLPYRFMHNSGTALAVLSLGRPVLVPDNDVNRALADEVGPGWVHTFEGELTAEDLRRFAGREGLPSTPPDLGARDWVSAGAQHREAFRRAASLRGRRG